jgi:hypothetical protein
MGVRGVGDGGKGMGARGWGQGDGGKGIGASDGVGGWGQGDRCE